MDKIQKEKIGDLLAKYNDILLVSMRLAVAEDFTNLIILNKDDKEFSLAELVKNKDEFSYYVMREFLELNSSSVTNQLSSMEEKKLSIQKQTKLKF